MAEQHASAQFTIDVDGSPLPTAVANALVSAVVEDNRSVPDMVELAFRDPHRDVLSTAHFKLGAIVTVKVSPSGESAPMPLLTAEVTALGVEADGTGTRTTIRGYDKAHRLFRGRRSETYADVTYADVARTVAQRAGLQAGQIDATQPVHERVAQDGVSDWTLIRRLAIEVGYEVAVADGKLDFKKPAEATQAPAEGTLSATDPLQLRLGADLRRVTATVTAAEQVTEVEVRGWDPVTKKPLVGTAAAKSVAAEVGVKPAEVANQFGGNRLVLTDIPYRTQVEVDNAAKAAAEQVAGVCAEIHGVARGNPRLRAGTAVSIGLAGEPFDGKYTLNRTRHIYTPHDGYTVDFLASGRQDRSLLALTDSGSNGSTGGQPRLPGVVPATVSDVDDPDKLGRIKVTLSWLSEKYTSDWLRVVQLAAGPDRGGVFLPEVNDEVLVAFEQGDMRHGYVIGGLYNGVDKPKLGNGLIDGTTGAVKRRGFISKKGHALIFFDDASDSGVAVLSGDQKLKLSLNGTEHRIRLTSDGAVEIKADKDITVKAGGSAKIEATGALELKGSSVKVQSNGVVEIKGSAIKLN